MKKVAESERTPILFLDLRAQYATIRDEVLEAVNRVLESQQFILGPEVGALEHEVASYSQCNYGIGVSSGTDALLVSLMAIDVGPGDEVITSAFSFSATASSISRLGAKPIFVDIDPLTYNIDPSKIESAITSQTKAILPVHLFGQTADMDGVMAVARKHDISVIEDAAQAIGAEYEGRRAGSFGDLGCFSFFPSKNLGGFGDGGMVTTNDPELAERIRLLRHHGQQPKHHSRVIGGNFRLDAIQAAVLRVKLKYLDNWIEARQQIAKAYRHLFSKIGLASKPVPLEEPDNGIVLPDSSPKHRHTYNQFVIRTSQRDALKQNLDEQQIGNAIYYPVPLHLQDGFADLGYHEGDLPISERASREVLALPIYPEMPRDRLAAVVDSIESFYTG